MYEGQCFTNLDKMNRADWPTRFSFPPRVGDYVEGSGGVRLRVVSVTHRQRKVEGMTQPFFMVELNK